MPPTIKHNPIIDEPNIFSPKINSTSLSVTSPPNNSRVTAGIPYKAACVVRMPFVSLDMLEEGVSTIISDPEY